MLHSGCTVRGMSHDYVREYDLNPTPAFGGPIMNPLDPRAHNDFCFLSDQQGFRDGTAADAIGRHLCHIALGECCVACASIPGGMRYPNESEIRDAKRRLADHLPRRTVCATDE